MSFVEDPIIALACLVVDDEASSRDLLTASLHTLGIKQVVPASNGSEAFTILAAAKRPFDLILADVRMPSGNGLQLLHALRSGRIKTMRVNATFILTTSSPTAEAVKAASSLDANGFVIKPVLPDKLQAAILKARRTIFPAVPGRYANFIVPTEL